VDRTDRQEGQAVLEAVAATRMVGPRDLGDVRRVLQVDPLTSVFVASRIAASGLDRWRLGAQLWGYPATGPLRALCHAGANLVPVLDDPAAAAAFAVRAANEGRRCLSIVGMRTAVSAMWDRLAPVWGPARDVRGSQPFLVIDDDPLIPADPLVRRVLSHEVDALYPSSVAMFTEEVGISPEAVDGGAAYRASVTDLVRAGRAFARFERGRVIFKAEVGVVSPEVCQVQGVWVAPGYRGRGLAAPGMAAVVRAARAELAPAVTLYVNDYNTRARRAYAAVGFRQHTEFMSVLF